MSHLVVDSDFLQGTLRLIGRAIRRKTGRMGTIQFVDMPAEIDSIETGVQLDHTVTILDDQGETKAVYTVADGVGNIAEPSGITAKKWVESSGSEIFFPINPTEDIIIRANNDETIADKIKQKQNIPDSYKYMLITNDTSNYIRAYYFNDYTVNGSTISVKGSITPAVYTTHYYYAYTNAQDLVNFFKTYRGSYYTSSSNTNFNSASGQRVCTTNIRPTPTGWVDIDTLSW